MKYQRIANCNECNNLEGCEFAEDWRGISAKCPMPDAPSLASIKRLCKAVRHEARDNGRHFERETIEALKAVEKQMKGQRK